MNMSISRWVKQLRGTDLEARRVTWIDERDALGDIPNAFPYVRCIETERAGYLIRQHLYGSLYDRIRYV